MQDRSDRTPTGWDDATEGYDRVWAPFFRRYAEDALRLAGVTAADRLLDVAAGPGTLTIPAARMSAEVVAVDFAPAMIARLNRHLAEEKLTNVTTQVMDGQALALPDDSFDAAFSMFGLIFFPDRAAGFRALHRVLRRGGVAVVGAWDAPERVRFVSALIQAARRALPDLFADPPRAVSSLGDPAVLAQEMGDAGFAAVKVHSVVHTLAVATPEAMWEAYQGTSPALPAFTESQRAAIRPVLVDLLRAEFGDGPVRLPGEAHIGVGWK